MSQFDKHAATLDAAIEAVGSRRAWSAYADSPALHPSGPDGQIAGAAAFAAMLGRPAPLTQPGTLVTQTVEVSPYTGESLAIAYPRTDPGDLLARSLAGAQQWSRAAAEVRVGVCLEILERLYLRNFEFQAASVHTTGMSLGMAYTGNGTNALDRGLEALAHAHLAMSRVTPSATWERRFGTDSSTLTKRYSLMPRGVAVAIACASFPAWNTYPALMASLATGNPVIVKPHPSSVIMLAMAVQTCREVIEEAGFDPDLVTLAVDGPEAPIAVALVEDPRCGIVDFTGSPRFGGWLETHLPRTLVFTETAGVNPVVLDSVDDLARVTRTIAGGLCLFSAQMCTSPQNIYLPREGVRTATGQATYDEVVESLLEAIEAIVGAPRRAAALLGAIQADVTERVAARAGSGARLLRRGTAYEHPEYPSARTRKPMVAEVEIDDSGLCDEEQFGPNVFIVPVDDSATGLSRAAGTAKTHGAIASYVYSTDDGFLDAADEAFLDAGANLTANSVGPMPMNFSAAYSDYHVSGLNPAGTATLTDEAFIAGRFRIVQSRRQI
jgi:phenylacetic acid degradation protein paaN